MPPGVGRAASPQAALGHVAARLDAGRFSPADLRTLTAAADDVAAVRSRLEAAAQRPGSVPAPELHALAAEVRRWGNEP